MSSQKTVTDQSRRCNNKDGICMGNKIRDVDDIIKLLLPRDAQVWCCIKNGLLWENEYFSYCVLLRDECYVLLAIK